MPRTITLDGAKLYEVRVMVSPTGQTIVNASFVLLSGQQVIQQISMKDYTPHLQAGELTAANALLSAISNAVNRVELS